ncbi:MAG: PqqD family protein [Syntrophobacteraceae bacterium]|jgi:hypothetical protein
MNSRTFLKINTPSVVCEIIDGEAVIVNMANGKYYSIDKVGADIWYLIENGASLDQIIDRLSNLYQGSRDAIESSTKRLIEEMQEEHLIVPKEDNDSSGFNLQPGTSGQETQFEEPVLHKYTDMEELLLLDPIHDVDETGWPNKSLEKA